jgi:lysophospholipase
MGSMSSVLHETAENPIPPNHFAGFFNTYDGMKLRYAVFRSGSQMPKGTIVLLQGRNESIEKYFETIRNLNEMGMWVATFDWRGQGGSPHLLKYSRKGHLRRFEDLERDLDIFLEQIVLPDAKLPFFIVAHSMGALVSLKAAPKLSNRIERMVLSAPFVGGDGNGVPPSVLKFLANVASLIGLGGVQFTRDTVERQFEGNRLTSDPNRFARNEAIVRSHPELALGPPTARWIAAMIGAIETVRTMDHLRRIEIPTLILGATADEVVPFSDLEALSQKFRAGKLLTINGARHEILQERDIYRNQALAAIAAFIPGTDADPSIFATE